MEQAFRDWLIKRGNPGAAASYPSAINTISKHYSKETGTPTDIYKITDQVRISEIAHDYRQTGKFSDFGNEQHGRFRAAISRYSEFFSQRESYDSTPTPAAELVVESLDAAAAAGFAYEKDLRTSLCAQVSELFPEYKIFGDNRMGR